MKKESQNNTNCGKHIYKYIVLIVRAILWVPAQYIVHYCMRMEVKGLGNIKNLETGRVIFAANHCSELDPYAFQYSLWYPSKFVPLYFVSLPKKYYPYRKYGLRALIYGGFFFEIMGAYPVYKGLHDFEKSFCHHIKILEKNHSVLMFPEGQMQKSGIGEARPGIIYLAKRTNAVVVPVKIDGTENLNIRDVLKRKRTMTITYGKSISPDTFSGNGEKLTREEYVKWSEYIMKEVKKL